MVVTPTTARIGETVTFDARASIAAEGTQLVSFTFNFGDGSSVTRSVETFGADAGRATHAYNAAGTYQPSVTITDSANGQRGFGGAE